MKIVTTLIIILVGILSCSINIYAGKNDYNGAMIQSTEYENQKMNNIQVGHAFEVRIIKTNAQSDNRIELNVSERVKPYVKTTLKGGSLSVTLENTPRNFSTKKGEMFLEIYTEEFSDVRGSGATDFTVLDGFDYNTLTLKLSGASDIKFESTIHVASDVRISGSGASDFEIGDLNTNANLSIHLSGASDMEIGSISVAGVTDFGLSGSTEIAITNTANFKSKVMAELSGASEIKANEMNVGAGFNYSMSGSSEMSIDNGECQSSENRLTCSGDRKSTRLNSSH